MLAYCDLHVEKMPGSCQLLAGDITQLERLLPASTVVRLLEVGKEVNLPFKEAGEFFTNLCGLDVEQLSGDEYCRSAMHSRHRASQKELVEALIKFLGSELNG